MNKEFSHYYNRDIQDVFNAYAMSVSNKNAKDISCMPYSTIMFILKYSLKYNMNGGSCTIRFMPYNGGTAVNVCYSIVQLFGARCEAHCNDIIASVQPVLQTMAQRIYIDSGSFYAYAGGMAPNNFNNAPMSNNMIENTPIANPQTNAYQQQSVKFCLNCGARLDMNDVFCSSCGSRQE